MTLNCLKQMIISHTNVDMQINIMSTEEFTCFKYLGIELLNKKIYIIYCKNYYFSIYTIVHNPEIRKKTKMEVYKTIYSLILTLDCESWNLSDRKKSEIQAAKI